MTPTRKVSWHGCSITLANGEDWLSPVPFFSRNACYMSVYDLVAKEWFSDEAFALLMSRWEPYMYPHEARYFHTR